MSEVEKMGVFDVDGTLLRGSFFVDLVQHVGARGYVSPERLEQHYAPIIEAARLWRQGRGRIERLHELTVRAIDDGYLEGISVCDFEQLVSDMLAEMSEQVFTLPSLLHRALKETGRFTLAVSGSPTALVRPFVTALGFDDALGTDLHVQDGKLTGTFDEVVNRKGPALREYLKKQGRAPRVEVATGDTPSDVGMLELAEHPIAFKPNPGLNAQARMMGIPIVLESRGNLYILDRPSPAHPRRMPRFYGETTLANILPQDVAARLRALLAERGIEIL